MDETKKKLEDSQLRILQIIIGIISAAALIAALFFAGPNAGDNVLLQYLWLIIFVVVMFGRRWVERRFRMRLALYNLAMLDALALLIVAYASILFFAPQVLGTAESLSTWSVGLKLLIIIGVTLLVLILGIIMPALRYFKRKEEGTLRPIRIPEPEVVEEAEEEHNEKDIEPGLSPLERQIREMTKDLDSPNESSDSKKDNSDK